MNKPLAFITGASSGIGQAMAADFYRRGYAVALLARREQTMRDWVTAQGFDAQRVGIYAADVAQTDELITAAKRCISDMGVPDVVVANAGISVGMDTGVREDLEVMRDTFLLNNVGLAATFHPFINGMLQRGSGRLVGIASVAGIRGLPGHGAYCASKAAVIGYCESLRGELRGTGVKVVTIAPGYVKTELTAGNSYSMPFLMEAADFSRQAVDVIEAGGSYQVIPWQMGWVAKLLRVLPNPLFDKVLFGRARKQRRN
jgi:short-subunit dehydrogenase